MVQTIQPRNPANHQRNPEPCYLPDGYNNQETSDILVPSLVPCHTIL